MQTIPYSKHCNIKYDSNAIELQIEGWKRADCVKAVFTQNFNLKPTYEECLETPGWVTLGFSTTNVKRDVFERHFEVLTPSIIDNYPH